MSDLAIVRFKEIRLHQSMEMLRKPVFGWQDVDAVERINGIQIIAAVEGGATNLVLIPWARIAYTVRAADPAAEAKSDVVTGMMSPTVPSADGGAAVEVPDEAIADIQAQMAKKGKKR